MWSCRGAVDFAFRSATRGELGKLFTNAKSSARSLGDAAAERRCRQLRGVDSPTRSPHLCRQNADSPADSPFVAASRVSPFCCRSTNRRRWLRRAIDSVRQQLYPTGNSASSTMLRPSRTSGRVLEKRRAARFAHQRSSAPRKRPHLRGLERCARDWRPASYIALLDHDDELAPTALYFAARRAQSPAGPAVNLQRRGQDRSAQAAALRSYFKPDWNPDLLTFAELHLAISEFSRPMLVRKVGGFRVGYRRRAGLRSHPALQPTRSTRDKSITFRTCFIIGANTAEHLVSVAAKPYARTAAMRTVQEQIDRGPTPGRVEEGFGDFLRVKYAPPPTIRWSRSSFRRAIAARCCRTRSTAFARKRITLNFEIIIIDNDSREPETLAYFEELAPNRSRARRAPIPANSISARSTISASRMLAALSSRF